VTRKNGRLSSAPTSNFTGLAVIVAKYRLGRLCYIGAARRRCGPGRHRQTFLRRARGRASANARVRAARGTVTANPLSIVQLMFAYQYEAARACTPYSALPPRASRSTGYGRGHHGMVDIGESGETVAPAGPQVSKGVSNPRSSRRAHRSRRTRLLPPESVAAPAKGQLTEMNNQIWQ